MLRGSYVNPNYLHNFFISIQENVNKKPNFKIHYSQCPLTGSIKGEIEKFRWENHKKIIKKKSVPGLRVPGGNFSGITTTNVFSTCWLNSLVYGVFLEMPHSNNIEWINIFTSIGLVYHVHIVAIHCALVLVRRIVPVRFLFDPDAFSLTIMIAVTLSITVPLPVTFAIAISVPVTISVTPSLSVPEEDRTMSHNHYNKQVQSKPFSQFNITSSSIPPFASSSHYAFFSLFYTQTRRNRRDEFPLVEI